jgi:DNA-binding SARP family transcriptional activator
LPTAEICAREATDKALRAGDEWIAALVGVTLGAAYAWHHTSGPSIAQQAIHWLSRSSATFRSCGDPFGQAVASLWLAWLALQGGRIPGIALDVTRHVRDLLKLIDSQGYPYLLGRRTLLGPPDSQAIVPLLLAASRGSSHSTLAQELVRQWGMANLEFHPGYSLRVQTLGIFRVWRGREEVTSAEWQRTRARQLFQLFITRRRQFIQREQILELLWPGASPEAAENQFKVVLTTLSKVLEPHRPAHVPPFFVIRHNSTYGLNPLALIQVDADSFERLVEQGRAEAAAGATGAAITCYRQALTLYQGDFLPECLYEDWCSDERERLLTLYLNAASRLASLLAGQGAWDEVIQTCQRILARDNCWEEAYRLMMLAYDSMGNRAMARRVYQECAETLRRELDTTPSPTTEALYVSLCH